MLGNDNGEPGVSNLWLQPVLSFSVIWGFGASMTGTFPKNILERRIEHFPHDSLQPVKNWQKIK